MRNVNIWRVAKRTDGMGGVVLVDNMPICNSLERSWQNNRIGISCIPTGQYLCKRVKSPKFGDTFEVTGVSGRTEILFHSGNIDDDSHGCILLGESFEPWKDGSMSLASSKVAFGQFMAALKNEVEFLLNVKEVA